MRIINMVTPDARSRAGQYGKAVLAGVLLLSGCGHDAPTAVKRTAGTGAQSADLLSGSNVPDWAGKLVTGSSMKAADDASTQEELPGLGHKFQLLYAMQDDQDPQNLTNDVISVLTTTLYPAGIGVAVRNTPPGFKINALTNQLQLKYYFPTRSCGGGSPRIELAIDTDGDGQPNGNAFGYVGHTGFGGGCVTGVWDFVDMTDAVPFRWDLTQFGLGYHSWQTAVAAMNTAFPNHRVLAGSLVDDSCGFAPSSCGKAYYDLLTIENRTLENRQDTVH
jgi:hypothetical protein